MAAEQPTPRRRSRRSGGKRGNLRGSGPAIKQMPWQIPVNSDAPTCPLREEQVLAIHDGAMRILEEIGIEFLHDEARDILAKAGCEVSLGGYQCAHGS